RCRHRLAARLLPVFGRLAGADRFLAVRRARRHRQAGDFDGREAALRRRFEAWRQLYRDPARRIAVGGARVVVEIVRLRHLCARPQAGGAVLVHRLCAAAHRTARHSGDQRQHQTVAVEIYRISDRNLVDAIAGVTSYDRGDFQRSLDRSDIERLKESRGVQVWKGDLAVDSAPINQDVTTAFPVDQAVGDLKPGVYVMVAQPQELKNIDSNYDALATQWFIVSDLGLAAFSGND